MNVSMAAPRTALLSNIRSIFHPGTPKIISANAFNSRFSAVFVVGNVVRESWNQTMLGFSATLMDFRRRIREVAVNGSSTHDRLYYEKSELWGNLTLLVKISTKVDKLCIESLLVLACYWATSLFL